MSSVYGRLCVALHYDMSDVKAKTKDSNSAFSAATRYVAAVSVGPSPSVRPSVSPVGYLLRVITMVLWQL